LGHRKSIDIDMFSDAEYGSIDFMAIDAFLNATFHFVGDLGDVQSALGKSYIVGTDRDHTVKVDVFYTDTFIQPPVIADGIRFATVEEIAAMKIDVIQRGGRKKDFWDIHELLAHYSIAEMLELHYTRCEYSHDKLLILKNLTDFSLADDDFDPICLRGKYWEFIKEDISEAVKGNCLTGK
jgi:hypothetical protein